MRRTILTRRGPLTVTEDLSSKLDTVEKLFLEQHDIKVLFEACSGSEGPMSLTPAGREVCISLDIFDDQRELNLLWGALVPMGFIPNNRYPHPGTNDDVFHYPGEWRIVYEALCAEGRGHLAWPSMCCAAQVDVGVWEGDKPTERFVQAQVHRAGVNCGNIDGVIGPRTIRALQILGLDRLPLSEVAEILSEKKTPRRKVTERVMGHIVVPDRELSISASGHVKAVVQKEGYFLSVDGPGRVVLDIGDPK